MASICNKETVELIAENYCTNGQNKTKALIDAGYDDEYADSGLGHRIYGNLRVKEAIDKRMAEVKADNIANRIERQRFWTVVLNNGGCDMRDRLRASELLGKSEADFTENINTFGDQQRELDETQALEAKRLARLRLADSG